MARLANAQRVALVGQHEEIIDRGALMSHGEPHGGVVPGRVVATSG